MFLLRQSRKLIQTRFFSLSIIGNSKLSSDVSPAITKTITPSITVPGGGGGTTSSTSPVSTLGSNSASPSNLSWLEPQNLTPQEVVDALSKHIVGQESAKKAIAIALRNRWRRMRLSPEDQAEIIPKNILMVGPTGCGKTEIARRLAKLCRAPFVKVEATKFTEVGYHGRDVDTIIKDLMDASLQLVKELKSEQFREEAKVIVQEKLVRALTGQGAADETVAAFLQLLKDGALEDREVKVEVPLKEGGGVSGGVVGGGGLPPSIVGVSTGLRGSSTSSSGRDGGDGVEVSVTGPGGVSGATIDIAELMSRLSGAGGGGGSGGSASGGRRTPLVERTMKVREARIALEDAEVEKRLSGVDLRREAVVLAEQNGIVFIDEIDKLVSNRSKHSGDASSEGVQRDLLPLIEGTVIEVRRFGNVKTDYMLFVASGAFHEHKPSELLAELQGRLPIRVELKGLDAKDLERILTETKFNMLEQQKALMRSEGIHLDFEPAAILEIARLAAEVNRNVENIGARRLHTVIEKVMEDISFTATDLLTEAKKKGEDFVKVTVDVALVRKKLLPLLERSDFSKFIL